MIKRLTMVLGAGLLLSGCGDNVEYNRTQRRNIEEQLPAGCVFTDIGKYMEVRRVVIVRCASMESTTATSALPGHKSQIYGGVSIALEEQR